MGFTYDFITKTKIHDITGLSASDYSFMMSLTGILIGFCLMTVTFFIVVNIKS